MNEMWNITDRKIVQSLVDTSNLIQVYDYSNMELYVGDAVLGPRHRVVHDAD